MNSLLHDIKYALRILRKSPGFTLIAVLTLALGIGANTAIFSVVNSVLLKRLPYPDPSRLVTVYEKQAAEGEMSVAWPNFADWRNQIHAFQAVAATRLETLTLSGLGPASRIRAAQVSPSFFPLLSVAPRMGRTFTDEEDVPGAGRLADGRLLAQQSRKRSVRCRQVDCARRDFVHRDWSLARRT